MKIISLNTWGGRAGKEKLLSFLIEHKDDTDIFCLQEILSGPHPELEGRPAGGRKIDHREIMVSGLQDISELLSDFVPYFRPQYGDNYGLLTLVRKGIQVKAEGEIFVYKHKGYIPEGDAGNHARNINFVTLDLKEGPLSVINFHGIWNGKGKGDSEDRISQSEKICDFIKTLKGEVIICGDFNLLPSTESISIFEKAGLRNLIKETGVTSTRTSYYTKLEKFADYAFVSKGVSVKEFKVLPDEVSDHSPLYLEID